MPQIRPFRGLRFNEGRIDIADVVAPPYDVIGPELQAGLYDRSPFNVVRLILGREDDRYAEAARTMTEWTRQGILRRDELPSLYILEQVFRDPQGSVRTRIGLIATCEVVDFSVGSVVPHEKTLSKPKEDRFKLLQATNTNFSQIFSLYSDPDQVVDGILKEQTVGDPLVSVDFQEVTNRLWSVTEPAIIGRLREEMAPKTALIADGHHRYETALAYRDMMRIRQKNFSGNEPFHFTMMFFANMASDGLLILPTHRMIHGIPEENIGRFRSRLGRYFTVRPVSSLTELSRELPRNGQYAFGLIEPEGSFLMTPRDPAGLKQAVDSRISPEVRELDVTILHSFLLEELLGIGREAQEQKRNIEYAKDPAEVETAVAAGKAQIGFLTNPTSIEQVRRVAGAGQTMPQKSTYFYPKVISGLVMNPLE